MKTDSPPKGQTPVRIGSQSACFLLTCLIVAGFVGGGLAKTRADEAHTHASSRGEARSLSQAFREAARKATPAVVTVYSYGQNLGLDPVDDPDDDEDPRADRPGPIPPGQFGETSDGLLLTGLGSGVIISADGLVITNNHVIVGAKKVVVQFADETEIEATDVHGDKESDVATLRIAREEPFPVAEIGDSDALEIGDWVLAIGSPFRLEATVSAGIISAKNRILSRINRSRLIQTDAAINPGNSGGPLIDLDGKVIAISTAIATRNGGYQGIGFAIPINQAKWIADELSKHGQVRRAAIGITMAELKPKIANMFNLPVGLGVLAYEVIEGSTAEQAGIKPVDVILEFAGERVRDPRSLREAIERSAVGTTQAIKVLRGNEEIVMQVELATREDPTARQAEGSAAKTTSANHDD